MKRNKPPPLVTSSQTSNPVVVRNGDGLPNTVKDFNQLGSLGVTVTPFSLIPVKGSNELPVMVSNVTVAALAAAAIATAQMTSCNHRMEQSIARVVALHLSRTTNWRRAERSAILIAMRLVLLLPILLAPALSAQPRINPGVAVQKEAMKKLAFLAGKWKGEATVQQGPGKPIQIVQTEEIEYRLDGTIMLIEGTGRDPESGKVVFNAVAVVSYDETKQAYAIRAYSDGRKVDSDFVVDGQTFAWGFPSGPASIRHFMRVNDKGEWEETTTVKIGDRPEMTAVRMRLQKQ